MEKEFDFEVGDLVEFRDGSVGGVVFKQNHGIFPNLAIVNGKANYVGFLNDGKNSCGIAKLDVVKILQKATQPTTEPKQRKIVSFKVSFDNCSPIFTALCDDDSVWFIRNKTDGWLRLPDIPQD